VEDDFPPRETKATNQYSRSYLGIFHHITLLNTESSLLGHLLRRSTSVEDSIRLLEATFQLSKERDENTDSALPGFSLGSQTAKRSRMPILLAEFTERERILKLITRNLNFIRQKDPKYAINFKPNVLIAFLVKPGGHLRMHVNERTGLTNFVCIFTFGCTVRFCLEMKKEIQDLDNDGIEYSKCKFNFKSQDFLTFDGVQISHGYKNVKDWTFKSENKIPLTSIKHGITKPYRLALVAMEFSKVDELMAYYYHGQVQHTPLYS
jgi:hypothetical protein